MQIRRLSVHNLRVIRDLELKPAPGLNVVDGPNGAGKTSLLEAVYFAGRARGFRSRDLRQLVTTGADEAHVFVELEADDTPPTRIGVGWRRGQVEVRRDGEPLHRRSDLMHALSVQLVTARSHALIEQGPSARRRFLDLGLFHVEQGYQQLLSEYGTALRQRNAALRSDPRGAGAFEPQLVRLSDQIDAARSDYLVRLGPVVQRLSSELGKPWPVELVYRPGWRGADDLATALARHFERDRKLGHTTCGAHRGGLVLLIDDQPAEVHLSRGQQKILVYALLMAQSELQFVQTGQWPILLVDDLPAELDAEAQQRVLDLLSRTDAQCLATATGWPQSVAQTAAMFHVEHGSLVDNPAG